MSLDKTINSGKEKRKPYRGAKSIDTCCRNNGGCPHCEKNRLYKNIKRNQSAEQKQEEIEPCHQNNGTAFLLKHRQVIKIIIKYFND